jgi:hypothetical protein
MVHFLGGCAGLTTDDCVWGDAERDRYNANVEDFPLALQVRCFFWGGSIRDIGPRLR